MKAHEANFPFATSVGADSIPATFNHGRGVSFEGIEPMIAYCKKDAQSAFSKLAAVLEKTAEAEIAGDQPIDNADVLNTIERIVEADPIANPIRAAFEKAWDIAARAGDTETERELHTRHADLTADFNAITDGGETDVGATYRQHLRSHAAWIRGVGKSIGKPAKTALHDTCNSITDERLERIETKLDNSAALIEKSQAAASRGDKGKKHKKTQLGWRKQIEMVTDFSKCSFKYGGKTYGAMTEDKAKDWEARYPTAERRERKSGYYSEMRCNPDLKTDYWNAAAQWNEYWKKFKLDFTAWLKDNPNGTIKLFKMVWTPPGKTVALNHTDKTMRYGADTRFYNSPDGNDI